MTKMIVDDFKSKKNGKIVFISSVAGLQPYKNSTAYVASKYGLRGFASALREELREFNIKVMTITALLIFRIMILTSNHFLVSIF